MDEHSGTRMRFDWGLLMNSVTINFNHHENPIFKHDKIWFDPSIVLTTFDEHR